MVVVEKKIRTISRGLLMREGRILLIQVKDKKGDWWILPGGGQEFGESLAECLKRECMEELGISVHVGACILVREFIGEKRTTVVGNVSDKHFLEHYFLISSNAEPDLVTRESSHVLLEWVALERLEHISFFPKILTSRLKESLTQSGSVYVGDAD